MRQGLAKIAAAYRPGHGLERAAYLGAEMFEADLDLLCRRWIFAGHVSEVTVPGDWITAELGPESAIVARGDDGILRAFANVCRHRGSRLCTEARGSAGLFTCPYHAWTYRLDGSLRAAREMPPGFDPERHGLKSLALREIGGLIFIAFAQEAPSLDVAAPALESMTRLFDWGSARVALRRSYEVAANWKLVMENYHECYHCAPAHPEFAQLHTLARPSDRRLVETVDPLTGLADFEAWGAVPDGFEVVRVMQSRLVGGCHTGSRNGLALAPAMGRGAASMAGRCVFAELGFLSAFLAYVDHGVIYRFSPVAPQRTRMEVLWLVAGAAREGLDFDVGELAWLWDVTSLADKAIIERNQVGVLSRAFEPGPFSLMEPGTAQYVARYVGELALIAGEG